MLYVSRASRFTSTQFVVLNLDGWFGLLSNKFIFFDIPLLYYYINLKSAINIRLSSGDIYLSLGIFLGISLLFSFITVYCVFFEAFVILLAILLPVSSAFF